jgi:hypothetical protein
MMQKLWSFFYAMGQTPTGLEIAGGHACMLPQVLEPSRLPSS